MMSKASKQITFSHLIGTDKEGERITLKRAFEISGLLQNSPRIAEDDA
jgi:hypothetical protein